MIGITYWYSCCCNAKIIIRTLICNKYSSTNLIKNGCKAVGNRKDYGFSGVIQTKRVDEATQEKITKAYQKHSSLREVDRIFNVSHQSVPRWI